MIRFNALAASCLAALLTACSGLTGSSWTVTKETDAMTSLGFTKATTTLSGASTDFETTVTCADKGALQYVFNALDKSGEPTPMQLTFGMGSRYFPVWVRVDEEKAYQHFHFNPPYNNQARLTGRTAYDAARAQRLTLRFVMAGGIETVEIDQSTQAFRDVVQPCLDALAALPKQD